MTIESFTSFPLDHRRLKVFGGPANSQRRQGRRLQTAREKGEGAEGPQRPQGQARQARQEGRRTRRRQEGGGSRVATRWWRTLTISRIAGAFSLSLPGDHRIHLDILA